MLPVINVPRLLVPTDTAHRKSWHVGKCRLLRREREGDVAVTPLREGLGGMTLRQFWRRVSAADCALVSFLSAVASHWRQLSQAPASLVAKPTQAAAA